MVLKKRGAMEMSVGTIVTIVLLMTLLVLGIFLIQRIIGGSTDAVDAVNRQVIREINDLFGDETRKLSVFPNDREITIKRGDTPKGFAFDVRNNDGTEGHAFSYYVEAQDHSRCGREFLGDSGKRKVERYLIGSTGEISLGPGSRMDNPEIIRFSVPEDNPLCPITYKLYIEKKEESGRTSAYSEAQILVNIK